MRKVDERLVCNSCPNIKLKKDNEKQDMTKHKLGPSKEMSAVQKNPNKPKQQKTVIKENSKINAE